MFRKADGPIRLDGSTTAVDKYPLAPASGGSRCKVLQYMIKVIKSSGTDCQVGLEVEHGPDGNFFTELKFDMIGLTDVSAAASTPMILEGAVGQDEGTGTKVVGEWIRPSLTIRRASGTGPVWALVELYEIRKLT